MQSHRWIAAFVFASREYKAGVFVFFANFRDCFLEAKRDGPRIR